VAAAVARDARPTDLVQPGHIFPLQAQDGGVLMRAGHTEAGCDLARMAGLEPAAVICEVMKDDGTMARLPDLQLFAQAHGLKIGTIADLIGYRSRNESLIQRAGVRTLHTPQGVWDRGTEVLVRVHEPFTAIDLLDAGPGGHSWPLPRALAALQAAPHGVSVLLNCTQQLDAMLARLLPETEPGTAPRPQMDLRTYGVGAQILLDLGVTRMKLLGSPRRMPSMAGFGLEVTGFVGAQG
jgi:3,4-dihydroxy 2-butanone 4-phosphate synthase/GTP cyclohydrolase II